MTDALGRVTSYQYDPLYRLTQVTYPTPQTDAYTYDPVGNRLTRNATAYTYDAADQMLTAGGVSYGYDNNGNQTSRGTTDFFQYDHENRLTQSVIGGVTSTSVYNGDGLRMSHNVSGQTTSYTWDPSTGSGQAPAAGLPVVLQDGTNMYVYGLDLISATDGAGVQVYFLYDGLGSTTDLTDGNGNSTAGYGYDVFGGIRTQSGTGDTMFKFTGEQLDADSGMYYLRARYYDPSIGRFLSQDPLPAGHPYAYGANNPVRYVDPSGLANAEGSSFRIPPADASRYEWCAFYGDADFTCLQEGIGCRGYECPYRKWQQSLAEHGERCYPLWACAQSPGGGSCSLEDQLGRTCPPEARASYSACDLALWELVADLDVEAGSFLIGGLIARAGRVAEIIVTAAHGGGAVWTGFSGYKVYEECF